MDNISINLQSNIDMLLNHINNIDPSLIMNKNINIKIKSYINNIFFDKDNQLDYDNCKSIIYDIKLLLD